MGVCIACCRVLVGVFGGLVLLLSFTEFGVMLALLIVLCCLNYYFTGLVGWTLGLVGFGWFVMFCGRGFFGVFVFSRSDCSG